MLRKFILQPDQDKRLQVEGRFLVITQATGPIELSIGGTTPITVDEKDRVHMRDDSPNNRAIRIKNVSGGVNTIELHTSDLLIDKRTGVDVQNSIAIQEDQLIGIDPGANIVQAVVQNPIRFDAKENAVKIEPGQCIGIDLEKNTVKAIVQNAIKIDPEQNDVKAEIQNELVLAPGQKIGIHPDFNAVESTVVNPVKIRAGEIVGIDPDKNTVQITLKKKATNILPTLVFDDTGTFLSIDENEFRDSVILSADFDNISPVWLGGAEGQGTPIHPGDRVFIEGSNRLDFIAPDAHILYASEIVHVV